MADNAPNAAGGQPDGEQPEAADHAQGWAGLDNDGAGPAPDRFVDRFADFALNDDDGARRPPGQALHDRAAAQAAALGLNNGQQPPNRLRWNEGVQGMDPAELQRRVNNIQERMNRGGIDPNNPPLNHPPANASPRHPPPLNADNPGRVQAGGRSRQQQGREREQPLPRVRYNPPTDPNYVDQRPTPTMADFNIILEEMQNDEAYQFKARFMAMNAKMDRIQRQILAHQTKVEPFSVTTINIVVNDLAAVTQMIGDMDVICYLIFPGNLKFGNMDHSPLEVAIHFYDHLKERDTTLRSTVKSLEDTIKQRITTGLKPPKLSVPLFSGMHSEWMQFQNNFNNLTQHLPIIDKFRLLIEAVKGSDAFDTIKDLTLTDVNWPIAWARMESRYSSPREQAHSSIRPLLQLPPITQQTESSLHKLVATVRTTRAQLKDINTGQIDLSDLLFLHLVLGKLDGRTISEFNQTLPGNDIPPLETCLAFLEKKAKDVALTREIRKNANLGVPQATRKPPARAGHRGQPIGLGPLNEPVHHINHVAQPQRGKPAQQKGKGKPSGKNPPGKPNLNQGQKKPSFTCPICKKTGHRVKDCAKYTEMTHSERRDAVKQAKLCFSCLSPKHSVKECTSTFKCTVCGQMHHTTLHMDRPVNNAIGAINHIGAIAGQHTGLLPTAQVFLKSPQSQLTVRCLLDSGAQGNFIPSHMAKALHLKPHGNKPEFNMPNGRTVKSEGWVKIALGSPSVPTFHVDIEAYVLPKIGQSHPGEYFDISDWDHISSCQLADPTFNKPGKVEVIIGMPTLDFIMTAGKITGKEGQASAYSSLLGYVMMGGRPKDNQIQALMQTSVNQPNAPGQLGFDLQNFWVLDSIRPPKPSSLWTAEEQACEDHYQKNTVRLDSGRYQIRWPFVTSPESLGYSYNQALRRWMSVEHSLLRKPELHRQYVEQLQEYLDLGQMSVVPANRINEKPNYYIPHHAVFKPTSTSTKLRIVFDASAKSTTGVSLNELLPPGPSVQPDLFRQLLHFREGPVGIKADITKMYRQIFVQEDERSLMRILWRSSPKEQVQHYQLHVVPFGVTTAPFIACRTLQQLADDESHQYPQAASVLRHRFYVDDLSTSVKSDAEGLQLHQDLVQLLKSAGFDLRKWATNSVALLQQIPEEDRETADTLEMDDTATVKTLGLTWSTAEDMFGFTSNPDLNKTPTKRNILSEISKVFDPLGLISPVIVKAKILMQHIWMKETSWDEDLPEDIKEAWFTLADTLPTMKEIKIPRALRRSTEGSFELHGFSDASIAAYSACVYIRAIYPEEIVTTLIASKTRVAPLKTQSIPRLELQGAVLLTELTQTIKETLSIPISRSRYWTDSAIVLHWLNANPQRWKTFVQNRVALIQELAPISTWAHVLTEDNPADCASRGMSPEELRDHRLWWEGPRWLRTNEIPNPPIPGIQIELPEARNMAIHAISQQRPDDATLFQLAIIRIGRWTRTTRVLARIQVALRQKSFKGSQPRPADLQIAEVRLVRMIQQQAFPELISDIKKGLKLKQYRMLRSLAPFIDAETVIRVGGRLQQAHLPFATRHPAILPGDNCLVRALIMEQHLLLLHAGKRVILNELRGRFWITNGTKHIKSTIDKCLICFRYKAQPTEQMMGQLPSARVSLIRPFLHTGVDLAGPYQLKNFTGRAAHYKAWICLFTCMATRAIHLELVSSLSAEGFLLAFRRFVSRRGKPSHVYSDNGTNFVGAKKHLQQQLEQFTRSFQQDGNISLDLDLLRIEWKFSPPLSPHFGGAWESAVRLIKHHLRTQIGEDVRNWEQMETLLCSIEAIVNSRPLTPIDEDTESLEALTPAHFLIGTTLTAPPEPDLSHLKLNRMDQHQLVKRRTQDIWHRFHRDYLQELQKRQKWQEEQPELQVGDLVLLLDDHVPPLHWKTARIQHVHPGKDNLVRVITAETAVATDGKPTHSGVTKKSVLRSISKIAKLPLEKTTAEASINHISNAAKTTKLATWIWFGVLMTMLKSSKAQNPEELPVETTLAFSTIAFVLAIVGLTVNIVAICRILSSCCQLKNGRVPFSILSAYHWTVLSLCASDSIISGFLIPTTGMRYLFRRWILGPFMCRLYSALLYGTVTWTFINLITIAALRYYCTYQTSMPASRLKYRILWIIIPCCVLSYLPSVLPLFHVWGTIDTNPFDSSTCTILPGPSGASPKPIIWIIGVAVPGAIIYLLSTVVYLTVFRKQKGFRDTPARRHSRRQLRKSISQVFLTFGVCYQPILVLNCLDNSKQNFSPYLHLASMILAWSTTILHPLVYLMPAPPRSHSSSAPPRKRVVPTTVRRAIVDFRPPPWTYCTVCCKNQIPVDAPACPQCGASGRVALYQENTADRTYCYHCDKQHIPVDAQTCPRCHLDDWQDRDVPVPFQLAPDQPAPALCVLCGQENVPEDADTCPSCGETVWKDVEYPPVVDWTKPARTDSSTTIQSDPERGERLAAASPRPRSIITTILGTIFIIMTCSRGAAAGIDAAPIGPHALMQLPPCKAFNEPMIPVPACTSTAHWIETQADATACIQTKGCPAQQSVRSDATGCETSPECASLQIAFINNWTCQHGVKGNTDLPVHLLLKEYEPGFCSVGNIHLRNCQTFKETIQRIPVLLIKGLIFPVNELHMGEDHQLKDILSYNCSCDPKSCMTKQCRGDSAFCQNVGCVTELDNHVNPCYCQYVRKDPQHVFLTPSGNIYPDCFGFLTVPAKVATGSSATQYTCEDCSISCITIGVEIHTPGRTPKYVKATKNPGFVARTPVSDTTQIPFSTHMLTSHGTIRLEIWFENADTPIVLTQRCPRIGVCQAISCSLCRDRWLNFGCWNWVNWSLIGVFLTIFAVIIALLRPLYKCCRAAIRGLTWPCRRLWTARPRRLKPESTPSPTRPIYTREQYQADLEDLAELEEAMGIPLMPLQVRHPYRGTTTTVVSERQYQRRTPLSRYRAPLVIMIIGLLIAFSMACSEFAAVSVSSSECRKTDNQEICSLQFNTRIGLSPIGQTSCFRVTNQQQKIVGTIEIVTAAITVVCQKQTLYFVPQPKENCQSHFQCFSLYSSSDCSGDKCANFNTSTKLKAFENTQDQLGITKCLSERLPSCPWWLTRDCEFVRIALTNPSRRSYEVFNCPTWQYSVKIQVNMKLGNNATKHEVTLRTGEAQKIQDITLELLSASIPPTPVLNHCFLKEHGTTRTAIAPCNDREEIANGRLGEIQCNSPQEAETLDKMCKGSLTLINSQVDSVGIRCTSQLIDPDQLLTNNMLPLRLEDGMIIARENLIHFDSSASSLLEIQMTASGLKLTAEKQDGICEASFISLEGCYNCISGSILILTATTTATSPMTATLECPEGILYTQMEVNQSTTHKVLVVHASTPEVDVTCELHCPLNQVPLKIKGHLHYLSEASFQTHDEIINCHSVSGNSLDFSWITLSGWSLSSWIYRGIIIWVLSIITFFIGYVVYRKTIKLD